MTGRRLQGKNKRAFRSGVTLPTGLPHLASVQPDQVVLPGILMPVTALNTRYSLSQAAGSVSLSLPTCGFLSASEQAARSPIWLLLGLGGCSKRSSEAQQFAAPCVLDGRYSRLLTFKVERAYFLDFASRPPADPFPQSNTWNLPRRVQRYGLGDWKCLKESHFIPEESTEICACSVARLRTV